MELRCLDIKHLEDIISQGVDQIGYTGQGLGRIVLRLLQGSVLIWGLDRQRERERQRGYVIVQLSTRSNEYLMSEGAGGEREKVRKHRRKQEKQ